MIRVGIAGLGFMGMIHYWTYQKLSGVEVVAIAEKDRKRLAGDWRDIKGNFGPTGHLMDLSAITKYESFEELLRDNTIDLIDICLPPFLHAEVAIKALQAGKHVFCEKPLAISVAEAKEMVAACRDAGVLLFEAFVFLYHPQTLKLRQLLDDGVIGDLLHVQAHMSFRLPRPTDNIRLNKEVGGGVLYDVGVYPITFARFAFGAEPENIQSAYHVDPVYEVDTRAALLLAFPGDRYATLQVGMDTVGRPGAILTGEKGHIIIPQPFHPQAESYFVINTPDVEETVEFSTGVIPFTPAVEHFHACILDGETPISTGENAIGTLRIVETVLSRTNN